MRSMDGLRFAVGTLSVFPVRVQRVDRQVAGRAMALAPAVGLVLGLAGGLPLVLFGERPLLAAALALALLALLTRALHLDGLADLADGLGSAKPADQALDIMKKSDIGPFGVVTLVFTLLVQVTALVSISPPGDASYTAFHAAPYARYAALVTACLAGRLALTWACRAGVPAARPDGLGAMVAGTVRRPAAVLVTLAAVLAAAAIGLLSAPGPAPMDDRPAVDGLSMDDRPAVDGFINLRAVVVQGCPLDVAAFPDCPEPAVPGMRYGEASGLLPGGIAALGRTLAAPIALLAGLAAALLLLGRARRRLGGVTGDVLGALVETAATVTLVAYALLA
ncbi:adenosylcobinamide-GDP ribazoletransferase [Nonomuraea sp. NPDC049419]|uniref:adenosylcobinamide-GDP ribazoletransferase n=1 Tax=Nonomuraea sp. NPDC049419 TaxID=3155772 RepID=UPI00343D8E22